MFRFRGAGGMEMAMAQGSDARLGLMEHLTALQAELSTGGASDTGIGLADYLTALQAELSVAGAQADKGNSKFSVDGVTIQVDISYTLIPVADAPMRTKPKFWVPGPATQDAKDGTGSVPQTTQQLSVRLSSRQEVNVANEGREAEPLSISLPASSTVMPR